MVSLLQPFHGISCAERVPNLQYRVGCSSLGEMWISVPRALMPFLVIILFQEFLFHFMCLHVFKLLQPYSSVPVLCVAKECILPLYVIIPCRAKDELFWCRDIKTSPQISSAETHHAKPGSNAKICMTRFRITLHQAECQNPVKPGI